jgi:hypothetical protein
MYCAHKVRVFQSIAMLPTKIAGAVYCITNVKIHTKHFCKKEMWESALGNKRNHEHNDRAYRNLILNINGTGVHHPPRCLSQGQGADGTPGHRWVVQGGATNDASACVHNTGW